MAVQKTNSMKRQPKSAAREPADIGKAFASRNQSDHTVKLTVELDSRLHRELKAAAALQSVTMREIIHDAVEAELKKGSVAKIVKLEHAWRRLDGRNDDGFQVAPFPG